MATSESELETEVRVMTSYDESVISPSDFSTVISRAKKFISNRRSLDSNAVDWFGDPNAEEALYWGTAFFCKVKTGELDGQNIAAGALDLDTLLAKEDNEFTTWFRNALNASRSLNPESDYSIRNVSREEDGREYGDDGR